MQTIALLLDSIRALRSRYLFWISLWISILSAVLLFGLISFNEEGWRILWLKTTESEFRAGTESARQLMSWMFNEMYVRWWLSWAAVALALISTASIMPDFLASGSIDLALSKPIARWRLMALKFLGAMLFVALQITLGVLLAYLLMGVKIGVWIPAALWAIPLITLQFFYLYSISTLIAVVTRSTVASLLITLIAWGLFSTIQITSNQIDSNLAQTERYIGALNSRIESIRKRAAREQREPSPAEIRRITTMQGRAATWQPIYEMLKPWPSRTRLMEAVVPKTADIQKILANTARAPALTELGGMSEIFRSQLGVAGITDDDEIDAMYEATLAGKKAIREVNATFSILTSLLIPLAALLAAGVRFIRKDY